MTHKEITAALAIIRPDAVWTLSGNTYEGLVWLDEVQSKPSWEDIVAAGE